MRVQISSFKKKKILIDFKDLQLQSGYFEMHRRTHPDSSTNV